MKPARLILGALIGLGALGVVGVVLVKSTAHPAGKPTTDTGTGTAPAYGVPGAADPTKTVTVGASSGYPTVILQDTGAADVLGNNPAGWDVVPVYIPGRG